MSFVLLSGKEAACIIIPTEDSCTHNNYSTQQIALCVKYHFKNFSLQGNWNIIKGNLPQKSFLCSFLMAQTKCANIKDCQNNTVVCSRSCIISCQYKTEQYIIFGICIATLKQYNVQISILLVYSVELKTATTYCKFKAQPVVHRSYLEFLMGATETTHYSFNNMKWHKQHNFSIFRTLQAVGLNIFNLSSGWYYRKHINQNCVMCNVPSDDHK